MQEGDELLVNYLARSLGRWLRANKRWKVILFLAAVLVPLGLAYQVLIIQPNRNAERMNDALRDQKEWELHQQPIPEEDEDLAERLMAWNEIGRRQRNPEYEIPQHRLELIKRHWEAITSDLTDEEIGRLREMLDL
jgi:hypothetical protein